MPSSKLEKYVNVLEVLALRPMKLDSIAYQVKMECTSVKRSLDFLITNGLAKKTTLSSKREVYAISERGLAVFRTLRTLKQLEELKKTMPRMPQEPSEEATVLAEHARKQK